MNAFVGWRGRTFKFKTIAVGILSGLASSAAYAELSSEEKATLMRNFAPLVKIHPKDDNLPSSVDWFLDRAVLKRKEGRNTDSPNLNDLLDETNADSVLTPLGNDQRRHQTYRGMPLLDGKVKVPVYAQILEKDQNVLIQYMFFFPYNEALFHFLGDIDRLTNLPLGVHEGDWEHVSVRLTRSEAGIYQLKNIYYAQHRPSQHGEIVPAKDIEFENGHPVVYSSLHGHASYPHEFVINSIFDRTSSAGPKWKTWENVVDVGTVAQPTPGNQWIQYKGHWGLKGGGPATPSQQGWWMTSYDQKFSVLKIQVDPKTGKSGKFDLSGKVPTWITRLYWSIENNRADQQIEFRVNQDRIGSDRINILGPISGAGTFTEVNRDNKLYISDLESLNKSDLGSDPIQVVIEGISE